VVVRGFNRANNRRRVLNHAASRQAASMYGIVVFPSPRSDLKERTGK
jgi:hypothetical protein